MGYATNNHGHVCWGRYRVCLLWDPTLCRESRLQPLLHGGHQCPVEIPPVLLGFTLLGFTNGRLLFSQSAFLAGLSCILCTIFFPRNRAGGHYKLKPGGNWVQLVIEGVAFMAASTAFEVLYIYCVELFLTNVSGVSTAASSDVGGLPWHHCWLWWGA
ncbi:hypothetical protein CRG98_007884 [Punica granatum]|uniref:Uncharacterized protein n=1 Tax=Punica granatum TaxID=22663 RepID=A0A2I0KTG5_PUNGR|nr:hypothetical protein CRG98_007884 [Punica granatum]